MSAPDRLTRVNEMLKREIADYLERDPLLKEIAPLVSVTSVKTAPNLRNAIVSISVMGGGNKAKQEVLKHLKKHRSNIQHQMSKDVVLKYTPVLEFILDEKIEKGDRVLEIIREMEQDASDTDQ